MDFLIAVQNTYNDLISKYKKASHEKDALKGKYNRSIYDRVNKYYQNILSFKRSIKDEFPYLIEIEPLGYLYDVNLVEFKYSKNTKEKDLIKVINNRIDEFQVALQNAINHREDVLDDYESFIETIGKWFNKYLEREESLNKYRYK